jgi:predicted dehydrogenase
MVHRGTATVARRHRDARGPRLGFLGTGWIGRERLGAIVRSRLANIVAIADPDLDCAARAQAVAPQCELAASLDELLDHDLDGLVIATPSALHAEQAIAALESGIAVFCQKPLGRSAREVATVIEAARRADRLLAVDLSYRRTAAAETVREHVRSGVLGPIHAVELSFHNAYGPDKPWFLDTSLSGGGCVIDLGTHLVDLMLWALDFPEIDSVASRRWRAGREPREGEAEDMCLATLELQNGTHARIACSWFSHEGREAVIEATFRGRDGAASLRNIDGSFYDFTSEHRRGTSAQPLASPPDAWPGRAAVDWVAALASGRRFDPDCAELLALARAIDRIYGRCGR